MVEPTADDELDLRTLEWADEMLGQWIEANEAAQAIQRTLPAEALALLPHDWSLNPFGLAMTVHPELVREGHALLESTRETVRSLMDRSLSHPLVRVDPKTDAERSGAEVGEDAERMERLERELSDCRRLLVEHLANCPASVAPTLHAVLRPPARGQ